MAEPQDYLLNENNDIYPDPLTGDWAFGPTNEIDIALIFRFAPGQLRLNVYMGLGIENYNDMDISAKSLQQLANNGELMLRADLFTNPAITILMQNGTIMGITVDTDRQI